MIVAQEEFAQSAGLLPLGFVNGLQAEAYHASPGISQSALKTFAEPGGPARYRAGIRKDSPALKFGGAFHTATLEPHLLEEQYCPTDLDREGTKAWAEAERLAGGRILLKRPDWDKARAMRDAVTTHPTVRQIIVNPAFEVETSMYWIDRTTGMLCRGRADGLRRDWHLIADLKSCNDASPGGFSRTVSEWGYDWQESFYRAGYDRCAGAALDTFVFIAIEKEPPFLIGCYDIEPLDIQEAGIGIRQAMQDLQTCRESDTWPGYAEELTRIRVPPTSRRKLPFN